MILSGRRTIAFILHAAVVLAVACDTNPVSTPRPELQMDRQGDRYLITAGGDSLFDLSVAKWSGGRASAVSITYDAPWGTHVDHHLATDAAIARGLCMDIEMVTQIFTQPRWAHLLETYRRDLLPRGVRFFGHGHTHALHDTMTYEGALASFSTCFDLMQAWGFNPRAYAYPGSSGHLASTQRANRDAGFICARGSTLDPATWHLLAGDESEVLNWFYLPAVPMGNGSYRYIQNHEQLEPVLEEALVQGSWVILMYHAIGIPEGWGYYPYGDFVRDLDQIASGDYWSTNLDRAAAYTQERVALTVALQWAAQREDAYLLTFDDGLPDRMYDEPLTVTFHFCGRSAPRLLIDPPVGTGEYVPATGDSVRLQLLPAEKQVRLTFE